VPRHCDTCVCLYCGFLKCIWKHQVACVASKDCKVFTVTQYRCHTLDRGKKHLHGWHAAAGNVISGLNQLNTKCMGGDVAGWSAAMCMHLLQWKCAEPWILNPPQSAVFINNLHMHLQHCAVLGLQSVCIRRCSSLVMAQVLGTCYNISYYLRNSANNDLWYIVTCCQSIQINLNFSETLSIHTKIKFSSMNNGWRQSVDQQNLSTCSPHTCPVIT